MQRRTGLTLVEVLVAIFIMGIGLIALLTLFPIGILRLAQAIRDERAAQAAASAHAIAKLYNVRNDPAALSAAGEPDLFSNPYFNGGAGLKSADPFRESYPVFVDPVGWDTGTGTDWVGGVAGNLRRRPLQFALGNLVAINQNFKLWDDITFDPVFDPTAAPVSTRPGTPKVIAPSAPLALQRDPQFSWAYLLRRPQTQDTSVVDCAVVVYYKRPTLAVTSAETVFTGAIFNPTKNTILVEHNPLPPNVRAGDWIYDATLYAVPATATTPVYGSAHSYFYRVVSIEDVVAGGKTYAKIEVQTPLRGFVSGSSAGLIPAAADPLAGPNTVYAGTVIVMDGVIEVFEKGPVRLP